jgi:hypothetical protein
MIHGTTPHTQTMTDQHPITPPPELVQQWWEQADQYQDDPKTYFDYVATEAAQWGADQELEVCCEWFIRDWTDIETADRLRAARRPKPPSLKEQALEVLERSCFVNPRDAITIRRALESIDD